MLGPFATRAAARPFSRCRYRYCRAPPAHRCPRRRQQRQRVTEGTAMAPWNGPNVPLRLHSCKVQTASCVTFTTRLPISMVYISMVLLIFPSSDRFNSEVPRTVFPHHVVRRLLVTNTNYTARIGRTSSPGSQQVYFTERTMHFSRKTP